MHYIVFDLEMNQADPSEPGRPTPDLPKRRHEIIQIGAVKLDTDLKTTSTFSRFVKPQHLTTLNPFVSELTGITNGQLQAAEGFPSVYQDFIGFIGDPSAIFCVWGLSDMKMLYREAYDHEMDLSRLPSCYMNVQPYASKHFKLSSKRLLGLEAVIERLDIEKRSSFHDALHDALYTAEVFRRIYRPYFKPVSYDFHSGASKKQRPAKVGIDFEALMKQFEKMYGRELSEEEQGMIKLAYRMGRTQQFTDKSEQP